MSFGYGVDIMAISGLAINVYAAYRDAPSDYRNISDEVKSLHIIINNAMKHFKSTTLSDNKRQEGEEVLRGCLNVLEDLDTFIVKYNSLASASTSQVLQRVKLGTEDIATLRVRLISNTTLLNGFIQSCDSDKIQARLDSVLGLCRTISIDSLVSFAGSINTKKAYKKFCKGLFEAGVTADTIRQKEKEIQDMFKPQHPVTSTPIVPNQMPEVGASFNAQTTPTSTMSTENQRSRSRLAWIQPRIDFLVGPYMLTAAETANTKRLISTLEYVRNINFADDQKETALHKAAAKGHHDVVQLLLSRGASIEAMDIGNRTPLHCAVSNGHTNIVELLLSKEASIEAMVEGSSTLLHDAASSGHTSTVELLLSKGAFIEAINTFNNTPLHLATWSGHTSIVELLLSQGASTEAMNTFNNTPLHLAAWSGHTTIVELLLSKGASTEALDEYNRTPLHRAAQKGHTRIVELLLSRGASMEVLNKLLCLTAQKGHTSTVELLISKGASTKALNVLNRTPLHYAAWNGHTSTVELLLSEGAPVEAMDEFNSTPLHCAASSGRNSIVELLLSKGASIDTMDVRNKTALHDAASSGHTSTVELLLTKGASIAPMDNSTTPLELATFYGHHDTAKLLKTKLPDLETYKPYLDWGRSNGYIQS